jgi:hypothetical protein
MDAEAKEAKGMVAALPAADAAVLVVSGLITELDVPGTVALAIPPKSKSRLSSFIGSP